MQLISTEIKSNYCYLLLHREYLYVHITKLFLYQPSPPDYFRSRTNNLILDISIHYNLY